MIEEPAVGNFDGHDRDIQASRRDSVFARARPGPVHSNQRNDPVRSMYQYGKYVV